MLATPDLHHLYVDPSHDFLVTQRGYRYPHYENPSPNDLEDGGQSYPYIH